MPRWVDVLLDNRRRAALVTAWLAGVATTPAVMLATGFGSAHPVTAVHAPRVAAIAPAAYRPASGAYIADVQRAARLEETAASRPVVVVHHAAPRPAVMHAAPPAPAPVVSVAGVGGAFGACVRQRENGGSYAWGTGDGGGAYQFEPGTWAVYAPWYKGVQAAWGSASPAQQDQAFLNALARGDAAAWDADGCPQAFGLALFSRPSGPPYAAAAVVLVAKVTASPYAGLASLPAGVSRISVPTTAELKADLAELAAQARAAAIAKARAAAQARAVAASGSLRIRALDWALAQAGKPYIWGATGPYGFDCSGLVYAAYLAMGRVIPRDTYEMLGAVGSVLIPVSSPQPGDLAFYGSGHVELYIRPGVTFGAQQPGTAVGYHTYSAWWHPTMFYAIAG